MKVLIISGFLGAGKTTFIKEMIKKTNREYVILENEFGDVNIDGSILKNIENVTADIEILEMSSGCVCCNTKSDFLSTLIVIENSLKPDFLVVEPSGIAMLSNVVNNINKIEYEKIQVLNPISIVDANTYFKYKEKYNEIFIDQIRTAKFIQLSKLENIDEELKEKIKKDIYKINENVNLFMEEYKEKDFNFWNDFFEGKLVEKDNKEIVDVNLKLENVSYKDVRANNPLELINFLERVIRNEFGDISRAKGNFKSNDYSIHFELVDKNYEILVDEKKEENNIVFIGKDINRDRIKNVLNDFI